MTIGELRAILAEFNQDEEIFVWRGNGNAQYFDYTSNIKISRPYGDADTNKGIVDYPLILSHDYEKDRNDEKRQRNS